MNTSEILTRRARFEASLRRSGWSEGEITYEWHKVQELDQRYDSWHKYLDGKGHFFSSLTFLRQIDMEVKDNV